jgi:hypothetical protein
MAESHVQVNVPSSPGKRLKSFETVDGNLDVDDAQAVVVTDTTGAAVPVATEPTLAAIAASLASLDFDVDAALTTRASEATLLAVEADTSKLDVLLSSRASEATAAVIASVLIAIESDTDNLDVSLSTRASEVTLAAVAASVASLDVDIDVALSTRASEVTLAAAAASVASIDTSVDVALSTRASEVTLASLAASAASLDSDVDVALSTRGSEVTLAAAAASLVSLDTDIDVALSTRASQATAAATAASVASIDTDFDVALSTRASEATLAGAAASLVSIDTDIDVALSTRASEATVATLATQVTAAAIQAVLEAIRDTAGIKKITDPLPAGTNHLGAVLVDNAAGAAAVNIQDGGNSLTVDQATAANLNAQVQGPGADGAALSGNPVRIGASDGANTQDVLADSSGRLVIVGPATSGSPTGGVLNVQGVDVVASLVALGALNAAATISVNGQQGVGFQLAAGTLIGTIVAEISYDAGTTYNQVPFWNQTTQAFLNNLVFGAANTATALAILVPPGASHVRVRVSAHTSGTANATVRGSNVSPPASLVSTLDGSKATYSAAITGLVFAASATDIFTITGSASKVVRVIQMSLSATQTASNRRDTQIVKRSTANTGGTSSTPTVVPHDSTDPAGTAVVRAYTANPTLGALVGVMRSRKILIDTPTAAGGASDDSVWNFGDRNDKSGILRGTAEVLAINMNAVTSAGNSCGLFVMWTEE